MYYSIISTLQTAINNLILREARSEASGRSSPRVSSTPSSSQVQVNVNGSVAVGASPDPLFGVTSTELAVTLEKILEEANQHQSSSNRRSSEQEGR